MKTVRFECRLTGEELYQYSRKHPVCDGDTELVYVEDIMFKRRGVKEPDLVNLIRFEIRDLTGRLIEKGILEFGESLYLRHPQLFCKN